MNSTGIFTDGQNATPIGKVVSAAVDAVKTRIELIGQAGRNSEA